MSIANLPPPTSKIGALRTTLLALLEEHERDGTIPTNARFLFYEKRVLIDILRARLDALLPETLSHVLEREQRQRRRMSTAIKGRS